MSTVIAPHEPEAQAPASAPGRLERLAGSGWALAIGVYLLAAAIYVVLSLNTKLAVLFPDEFRYAHLARSLADGDGFVWRGEHIDQTTALYSYFITPAYLVFDATVDAWRASKVMGTLVLCTQLFPVWLLARELLGRTRLALIPAVLAVAGTWMLSSAETATEVLAFPLATGALCAGVMALRRPGSRWGWVALALVLVGTWARIQLAVLVPALMFAFALDVLRDPAQRRARLLAHRPYFAVAIAGVVVLTIVALAFPSLAGDYKVFFDERPPLSRCFSMVGWQMLELVSVAGFVPVVLAAAGVFSPRAWRDDAVGPLLAVFWPAALATVVQSGFFLATQPASISPIGRYVTYAVPIALVLATVVVMRPHLLTRASLAIAGVLTLGLLLRPATKMIGEERASWAISYRLDQLAGVGPGPAMAIVAFALLAVVLLLRRRGVAPGRAAVVLALAVGAVLLVQSQAAWWQMQRTASSFRAAMPDDLAWIDHHAGGPVALLAVTQNAPQFDDLDYFNRDVTQSYAPAGGVPGRQPQGRLCTFELDEAGAVQVSPDCGPTPHGFLINDPSARVTFYNETHAASEPNVGRVVQVAPSGTPRARSLVILACPRMTPTFYPDRPDIDPVTKPIGCRPALSGALWLDASATLSITYRGGRATHVVTLGKRRWTLPPRVDTTIRTSLPAGYQRFAAQHDWASNVGMPSVRAVTLSSGGETIPLI